MELDYMNSAKNLLRFIEKAKSPFHVVNEARSELEENGFKEIKLDEVWDLQFGGKYYLSVFDSTVMAFVIGNEFTDDTNIRIATAHTDFPCLKIKPNCSIIENGYAKLNVEVYGGAILNTWLDRPLSVAGKVTLKSQNPFKPQVKFVDFNRPVVIIPNLAIHLNRDLNKGMELNKQKDLLPLFDIVGNEIDDEEYFLNMLSKEFDLNKDDILDYELYVYQFEKGEIMGINSNIISAPRLDNITSVVACLSGIKNVGRDKGLNIIAMFDNEEIGSKTKQGAASATLNMVIERIYESLGFDRNRFLHDISNGCILSADVGHCVHPNVPEKNDPTNKNVLNGGVVLKISAAQTYASDCEGIGIAVMLCDKAKVPYQKFVNRSDGTSGSTLGSIATTMVPMRVMDVGVPLLAMHSARECMGIKDQLHLEKMIKAFFTL